MERLRVATVSTESQRSIVKGDDRNTRQVGRDHKSVLGVARPEIVQDGGTKDVNLAELETWGGGSGRIQEAARRIATTVESVSRAGPVELGEEAIVLAQVIVQAQ